MLIGEDEARVTIEMTVVTPPFLLDFGKAYINFPPDFTPEVLADWERQRGALFEPDQWPEVKSLLAQLATFGIYYYDAKPGNITFGAR